jgi:hypothetical protein
MLPKQFGDLYKHKYGTYTLSTFLYYVQVE